MTIQQTFDLASQHHRSGRLQEAEALYRQVLAEQPNHAQSLHMLGMLAAQVGQPNAAIDLMRRSLALNPSWAEGHFNLGNVLWQAGRVGEAVVTLQQASQLAPNSSAAQNSLGLALAAAGQWDAAIDAYQRATALRPDSVVSMINLAAALRTVGRAQEAVEVLRRAQSIAPDSTAADDLLLTLHYLPGITGRQLLDEHRRWGQKLEKSVRPLAQLPHRDPALPRRLRIGYVSQDLVAHPAGRFLLPLLENHDRSAVEIFCYSNVIRPDFMTARFQTLAGTWRDIAKLSDEQAADQVRADQIDILVDLSLHTAGNRLGIFARKPAPIQATWLGYPGTTGLTRIDYRLTDPYLDPADQEENYVERTMRLPHCFWCYQPPQIPVEVNPLPALSRGFVTFASFNNFTKVNTDVLQLWARIMAAVPNSRLLLHTHPGSHQNAVRETLALGGVDAARIEFFGFLPTDQFLRLHQQADIALDPFPFNGGMTTCDSLWMGIPVVSLAGRTAVGRSGLSILSNAGLPELVAQTQEQYARIAIALTVDLPKLSQMRTTLRSRLVQSALTDAKRSASDMESAFRMMIGTP
ncbi:MAG TPA: tetratricopeptide repeat protein [Tepidisphaeraceae bacterium]|jgi:protein O-GlcNAc transferase|nr:tetratricopeptide repeat protein [Tepidisphaeraceae bacterium]